MLIQSVCCRTCMQWLCNQKHGFRLTFTNSNIFKNAAEFRSTFWRVMSESTWLLSVQRWMLRAETLRNCPVPVLTRVLRYIKTHMKRGPKGYMWKLVEIITGEGKSNHITVANGQLIKHLIYFYLPYVEDTARKYDDSWTFFLLLL